MNYDPNLNSGGRTTNQKVRLIFGQWEYRFTTEVDVLGNCSGKSAIDSALTNFYDSLEGDFPEIILKKQNGDELIECDDEQRGEAWLENMLISAEIISIEPRGDNRKSKQFKESLNLSN